MNVKSPEIITIEAAGQSVDVRLIGIEAPKDKGHARSAMAYLQSLLLDKNARVRIAGQTPDGELLGRLFTDDPVLAIEEVALEVVKLGLATRKEGFDFKYGELAAAENEARTAKRGLWSTSTK